MLKTYQKSTGRGQHLSTNEVVTRLHEIKPRFSRVEIDAVAVAVVQHGRAVVVVGIACGEAVVRVVVEQACGNRR